MQATSATGILDVLRIRTFFLLWLSQVLSQIAVNMLTFVVGVAVYETTRTNTAVSLLYLTVGVPAAIFGNFAGVFVDRLPKKGVLIFSTLIRALFVLIVLVSIRLLPLVYVLLALISVVSQFFVPAEVSLIPRVVPKHLLLAANSLFILTFYAAIIGGFVVGGPVLSFLGFTNTLLFLTAVFVLAALLPVWIRFAEHETTEVADLEVRSVGYDLQVAFRFITAQPRVLQGILLLTVSQAILAIVATLGPGFADRILDIAVTDASLFILGPATIGMVLGAISIGSWGKRFRKKQLIQWGIFVSGGILMFLSFTIASVKGEGRIWLPLLVEWVRTLQLFPIVVIGFFILGAANSVIEVSCNTVLQELTPAKLRGRVYGILQSLINGVALLPVVASGMVADRIGVNQIMGVLGVLLFGFGMYISVLHKKE